MFIWARRSTWLAMAKVAGVRGELGRLRWGPRRWWGARASEGAAMVAVARQQRDSGPMAVAVDEAGVDRDGVGRAANKAVVDHSSAQQCAGWR